MCLCVSSILVWHGCGCVYLCGICSTVYITCNPINTLAVKKLMKDLVAWLKLMNT